MSHQGQKQAETLVAWFMIPQIELWRSTFNDRWRTNLNLCSWERSVVSFVLKLTVMQLRWHKMGVAWTIVLHDRQTWLWKRPGERKSGRRTPICFLKYNSEKLLGELAQRGYDWFVCCDTLDDCRFTIFHRGNAPWMGWIMKLQGSPRKAWIVLLTRVSSTSEGGLFGFERRAGGREDN